MASLHFKGNVIDIDGILGNRDIREITLLPIDVWSSDRFEVKVLPLISTWKKCIYRNIVFLHALPLWVNHPTSRNCLNPSNIIQFITMILWDEQKALTLTYKPQFCGCSCTNNPPVECLKKQVRENMLPRTGFTILPRSQKAWNLSTRATVEELADAWTSFDWMLIFFIY